MFDIAGVAKPKNMENNECGDVCLAAGAESVAVQNVLIEKLADRIVRATFTAQFSASPCQREHRRYKILRDNRQAPIRLPVVSA